MQRYERLIILQGNDPDFCIFQKQNLISMLIKGYFCLEIGWCPRYFDDLSKTKTIMFDTLTHLELKDRRRLKFSIRHPLRYGLRAMNDSRSASVHRLRFLNGYLTAFRPYRSRTAITVSASGKPSPRSQWSSPPCKGRFV